MVRYILMVISLIAPPIMYLQTVDEINVFVMMVVVMILSAFFMYTTMYISDKLAHVPFIPCWAFGCNLPEPNIDTLKATCPRCHVHYRLGFDHFAHNGLHWEIDHSKIEDLYQYQNIYNNGNNSLDNI